MSRAGYRAMSEPRAIRTRRAPKIKPEPPVKHSAECEAAWSAYQTALRRHGVTMDGYNPSTIGPVATARGVYVKAARSCS